MEIKIYFCCIISNNYFITKEVFIQHIIMIMENCHSRFNSITLIRFVYQFKVREQELIINLFANIQSNQYTSRYSIFMHMKIFYFFFVILSMFSHSFNQFKSKTLFNSSNSNEKNFARKDTKKSFNDGQDSQSLGFSNVSRHNNILKYINWFTQDTIKVKVVHEISTRKDIKSSKGNSNCAIKSNCNI